MTSKEDNYEEENPDILSKRSIDSGHEEASDDDISYGSDVQVPGLTDGYVRVHVNCCRVIYRPSKASKDSGKYICLNKSSCRSQYGGRDHSLLRSDHRAEPGIYQGIYGKTGKLLAAKAGSRTSDKTLDRAREEARASDRAYAASMDGRNLGLDEDVASYSISDAEADVTVKEGADDSEVPNPPTDKDTKLLELMSALFSRIDKLESGMAERNDATFHQSQRNTKERTVPPSILRPKGRDRSTSESNAISSVARKHASTKNNSRKARKEDTEYEEVNVDEDGSEGYVEYERYRDEEGSDEDSEPSLPPKKPKATKTSSRPRLYAIAGGRGGSMATGLYHEEWDNISFLVNGFSKAKYRRVKSEKEGISFIRHHYKVKGISRPRWMKEGKVHYPSVTRIKTYLGADSDSSDDYSTTSGYESETSVPTKKKQPSSSNHKRMGVDPSMGKESELFGVDLKNVNHLEKGLSPKNLGKQTASLFLEQIDDMAAYPRHSSHKTQESLGDFVEAVTDLSHQQQGQRGGVRDTGWKGKTRNSLDYIKNSQDLNTALSYLMEEQHTIMETCQGDLESVLVSCARVDDETATNVVANSLALRIGRDTLHSYMSLLNHLSSISSTRGWEACNPHVRHHAEKIGLIRGKYRHRLQMICKVYIYLREGQSKNWMSLKLQNAEISSLRNQLGQQGNDGGIQGYNCSHCKSALHGGGKGACPWKDKSSNEAKKAAAAFMVRMANGLVETPTPTP